MHPGGHTSTAPTRTNTPTQLNTKAGARFYFSCRSILMLSVSQHSLPFSVYKCDRWYLNTPGSTVCQGQKKTIHWVIRPIAFNEKLGEIIDECPECSRASDAPARNCYTYCKCHTCSNLQTLFPTAVEQYECLSLWFPVFCHSFILASSFIKVQL